jgi:hypothetical protein
MNKKQSISTSIIEVITYNYIYQREEQKSSFIHYKPAWVWLREKEGNYQDFSFFGCTGLSRI